MTQPPNSQSTNLPIPQSTNPYVGPRTFTEREGRFFFGREREARDLTARIVSERLLLFYAQSGAGKSSLLNARVIPRLRDEERFQALPVGRVSGELPAGVAQVDNIYAFNLMTSLDQSGADPQRLAQVTLSDFLTRLAREAAIDAEGQRTARWVYKPEIVVERQAEGVAQPAASSLRFALVIDQFEEIITSHPGHWREREGFFRQLNQALLDDPNLWVVLSLREDYVASLDPYAELLFNRLRARFYMERMSVAAALDAVRRPAELAGRPFAPGAAEQLVDNLRQVRVAGQEATVPGQYVEPVQLQVVCFQMWENLGKGEEGKEGQEAEEITLEDLAVAGDVDRALTQFYEETLAFALADSAAAGVNERQVRVWFDEELITEAGTRGLVHQGERETGSLSNGVVRALQRRFLVRAEARGGDTWIELVHDRFVEPIRASDAAWFPKHLSTLQRQAALWKSQERPEGLLLTGQVLAEAEAWAAAHEAELEQHERDFRDVCRTAKKRTEDEQRQNRRIRVLAVVAVGVAITAIVALNFAVQQRNIARAQSLVASARVILEETGDEELAALLSVEANRLDGSLGYEVWDAIAKRKFPRNWSSLRGDDWTNLQQGHYSWSPDSRFLADTRIGWTNPDEFPLEYLLTTDALIVDTNAITATTHISQTYEQYPAQQYANAHYDAIMPIWSQDSRYVAFRYELPEGRELRIWDTRTIDGSVGQATELTCEDLGDDEWLAEVCASGSPSSAVAQESQHRLRIDNVRHTDGWGGFNAWDDVKEGTPRLVVWDESTERPIRTLPLPGCSDSSWSPDGRLLAIDTCDRFVTKTETWFSEAQFEPRILTLVHVKSLMHPCDWVTRNLTEEEWIRYVGIVPSRPTCDNLPSGIRPASIGNFSQGFRGAFGSIWLFNSGCAPCAYIRDLMQEVQKGALLSLRGRLWVMGNFGGGLLHLIALFLVFLLLWLLYRRIKERQQHKAWISKVREEGEAQQSHRGQGKD